jgi:hypothetical protein
MIRDARILLMASLMSCATLPAAAQTISAEMAACAHRDLEAFSRIEQHGEAGDVPGAVLAEATAQLLQARRLCREGRTEEGFAFYERLRGLGRSVAGAQEER